MSDLTKDNILQFLKDIFPQLLHEGLEQSPIITSTRDDVHEGKEELHRIGLLQEDMQMTMRQILDAVTPLAKKGDLVDCHGQSIDDLREDAAITKQVLKQHIADRRIHIGKRNV